MAKQYAIFEEWKADGSKPETALYIHKDELRKKEQDPRYTPAFYKLQTEEHYDLLKKLQEKRQEDEASDFGLIALRSFIGEGNYDCLKYTGHRLPTPPPRPPPIETVPALQLQRHDSPLQSATPSPQPRQQILPPQIVVTAPTSPSRLSNPSIQNAITTPTSQRKSQPQQTVARPPIPQQPSQLYQVVTTTPRPQLQNPPLQNVVTVPRPQRQSQPQQTAVKAAVPQQYNSPYQNATTTPIPQQSQAYQSATTTPIPQQRSQQHQIEAVAATSQQQSQQSRRSSAARSPEPAPTTPTQQTPTQETPPSYWTKKKQNDEDSPARRTALPSPVPPYPTNSDQQPIPQEIWELVNQLNMLPKRRNNGLPLRKDLGVLRFREHFLAEGILRKDSLLRKYKGDRRLLSEAFWMWICPPVFTKEEKAALGK